jgi:hypothetical protein
MKIRSLLPSSLLLGALILGFMFAGCAKPPTEEMEAAALAVTRAENDGDAVNYGGTSLVRAREALLRMQDEAAAKRYDAAKTLAAEAVNAAEKAISDGRAGASRARQEAANLVNGLRLPLAETGEAIGAARQSGAIELDFEGLDRDYDAALRTAGEAETSLAGNNYQEAVDKSQTVRSALSDINNRLANASQAVFRKK